MKEEILKEFKERFEIPEEFPDIKRVKIPDYITEYISKMLDQYLQSYKEELVKEIKKQIDYTEICYPEEIIKIINK